MTLKDLPENIQTQVLQFSNKIIRDLEGQPVELIDLIDKAVVAGMTLEATRHSSQAESLWQTLAAFRNIVYKARHLTDISTSLGLVDQCLLENKPKTIPV